MSKQDTDKPEGVSQAEALAAFNAGTALIINTPDGIQIMIQRDESNNVRAAIMASASEMAGENFLKHLASRGGMNSVVRDVLDIIGVTQEIKPDSGVLQTFKPNASSTEAIDYFNFPKK